MDLSKLHLHWGMSTYKGNSYRSYSLAHSYRENGKNRKKIVVKLGKLSDAEVKKWHCILKTLKEPNSFFTTTDDIVTTSHYAYLDVAVVSAVWDEWQLDSVFPNNDSKKEVKVADIAKILSINRSIDPVAKSQTPQWFKTTALPWMLNIKESLFNTSRVFRELTAIEQRKEAICDHLFKLIKRNYPDSLKQVFYDLSTTTFTGSRCVIMKWGHCKEGYKNNVVLALVVNKDGLPFYWETLLGGTPDSQTIIWLLEKIKARFQGLDITLVFDRGMVSDDNLGNIEAAGIKYISAMDKNQLENITGIDFSSFSHLKPNKTDNIPNFKKLDNSTYYREIKVQGNRRYILCFNPVLFKDQRKTRAQAVSDFQAFAQQLNLELLSAKKARQRKATYARFEKQLKKKKLISFTQIALKLVNIKKKNSSKPIRTYQAEITVDKDKMLHAGRLDGFWLLVTNHTEQKNSGFKLLPVQAITPYREKTVIESAFRDIKSFIEISPLYVWTTDHVKAHYTCCVLSYLINRYLTLKLHKNQGDITQNIVSHEKLYKQLSDCKIDRIKVKNVGLSTYKITEPTIEQKELVTRIGSANLLCKKILKTVTNF
jgi:transposase